MQRKVIQIANSTQLISLPRKWALKYGVKKGDTLDILESYKDLIIRIPATQHLEKRLELTIDSPDRFLRRMLFSPYIQGYTEIKVNYKDPRVFSFISDEVQYLMGYEIVTQRVDYCIIRQVASVLETDLANIISRIFMSTSTLMQDLLTALQSEKISEIESLKALEGTNNKLSYFSLRIITSVGYPDHHKEHSVYYIILSIEEIVDYLRDICDYATKNKGGLSKNTIGFLDRCLKSFKSVHSLFNKFDNTLLFEFSRESKKITEDIVAAMKRCPADVVILSYLHTIMSKISHISKEIHY